MSLLGWIGGDLDSGDEKSEGRTNVVLDHNKSERFECRWTTVKVSKSPAIMLRGMEGSVMGVWVAHGEGRFTFRNRQILGKLQKRNCLAIQYADDFGNVTEKYPLNPNGSIGKHRSFNTFLLTTRYIFLFYLSSNRIRKSEQME